MKAPPADVNNDRRIVLVGAPRTKRRLKRRRRMLSRTMKKQ